MVASGILYGKGECILNQHIKKAWLQEPPKLPFVGMGTNLVPAIHVTDLARIVKKIFENKPEKKYVLAIDANKKPIQKRLISAISDGIGMGLIESIEVPDVFKKHHAKKTPLQLDLDWRKPLLLNLRIKPSPLFIAPDPELNEEGEEAEADPDAPEVLEMDWHCKSGLAANIQVIKNEFCKVRGLKPIKICITGPPASGKTFYAKQLAEHYNVPHIHAKKLLEEIENWNAEKEDDIFTRRAEKKAKREEEEKIRKLEEERKKEELRIKQEEMGEYPE